MTTSSNAIVVYGSVVPLPKLLVEFGITASNYLSDREPHFKTRGKYRTALTHYVIHETCGDSAASTKHTFDAGKYAAQLITDETGHVSCHANLGVEILWHGNQLNGCSVGNEFVNPYNPIYDRPPLRETIPKQWWTWVPSKRTPGVAEILTRKGWEAVPSVYCLPTPMQLVVARLFTPWLCSVLKIPYAFPTRDLNAKKRKNTTPGPGVVAHQDFQSNHADGRYLLEAAWA